MRVRSWQVAFVLVLGVGQAASAQSVAKMVGSDFKHAAKDFVSIWASPFDASRKDWLIAAGVIGAGALVSPLDDDVDRWALRNRDKGLLDAIKPFRRGGSFYTVNKLTPYLAGLYVVGIATKHQGIRDGIMGCLSAYGANTTIRHQLIYRIVGRDRPEIYKNPGEDGLGPTPPAQQGDQYDFYLPAKTWGQHSFPGGHVANVATCASFFSHRFDWKLAEPVLAGLVVVMGVGRLPDRGHWLSDQVVGTVYGYAIGREVAQRQLARKRQRAADAGTSMNAEPRGSPLMHVDGDGMLLGWSVRF